MGEYLEIVKPLFKNNLKLKTMPLQPWKVPEYTALISQSGTTAPTVIILYNTLGNIVWTRGDTGIYYGSLQNAFIENQTLLITQSIEPGNYYRIILSILDDDAIRLNTIDNTGTGIDDALQNHPIKIQVYNI